MKSVTVTAFSFRARIANFFPSRDRARNAVGTWKIDTSTQPYPPWYTRPGPPTKVPALAALASSVNTRTSHPSDRPPT